jgi:hypothetical protein
MAQEKLSTRLTRVEKSLEKRMAKPKKELKDGERIFKA